MWVDGRGARSIGDKIVTLNVFNPLASVLSFILIIAREVIAFHVS